MKPLVKVFVPTYRRPRLLERALASLVAQTYPHWTAELLNDAPDDPQPGLIAARLGDPRIVCVNHPRNLGGVAVFNRCHEPGPEPFVAILEDDNAWEPAFLEKMLAALSLHPDATLAWCNQSLDRETSDGTTVPLGRCVHPWPDTRAIVVHRFGHVSQAFGALHANGAMLLRTHPTRAYLTPEGIPFTGVEPWRERLFPGPLVYVPEPLARFTITQTTARARDAAPWATLQVALIATFARAAGAARDNELWLHARASRPSMAGGLIQAGLADPSCRRLLRFARPKEWVRWLLGVLRRPRIALCSLRCRSASWWPALDKATRERFASNG